MESFTAPEVARELQVDPTQFRDWLRSEWRSGNPLFAGHILNQRWEFSRQDAEKLKSEFREWMQNQ